MQLQMQHSSPSRSTSSSSSRQSWNIPAVTVVEDLHLQSVMHPVLLVTKIRRARLHGCQEDSNHARQLVPALL